LKEDLDIELEQKTIYETRANAAVDNLRKRNILAQYVSTKEEALLVIMDMIPEGAVVGTADSATLLQVGVFSAIRRLRGLM